MNAPSNPFTVHERVALVTGGGTGIGYAISQCLIQAGAKVCISGRRQEILDEAVASLGPNACGFVGDVTEPAGRAGMIAKAQEAFGKPVTILINNAGQNIKEPAIDVTDEGFDELLNTHVKAGFALARDLAPGMIEAGGGSIVFLASMTSYMGMPLVVGYTTAKTAVLGLVRSLTAEWSKDGVRVNAIAPGWIRTPMTDKAFAGDPDRKAKVFSRTPMQTMGEPADIGQCAVYLCSDAAKFVTGQCICVDGGASIGF